MWGAYWIASMALFAETICIDADENPSPACFRTGDFGTATLFAVADMLFPVFDTEAADGPDEDWDLFEAGLEKPAIGTRTSSGAVLMVLFGGVIMLVMLNLLIAIMSSTYEAALDVATVQYKVYKVRRVVEYRCAPRLPGPFYILECIFYILPGRMLRKLGKCKSENSLTNAGWCNRTAFKWEKPSWKPEPEMIVAAQAALEEAKGDLKGGWESSTKAARAAVRRMQQRKGGGVATTKGVHAIVKVEVGEVHAALDADVAALDAKVGEVHSALDAKVDAKVAALEHKLDAIMELLKKKSE